MWRWPVTSLSAHLRPDSRPASSTWASILEVVTFGTFVSGWAGRARQRWPFSEQPSEVRKRPVRGGRAWQCVQEDRVLEAALALAARAAALDRPLVARTRATLDEGAGVHR